VPANGRDVMRTMLENGVQINAWADHGYEDFIRITVSREESNSKCLATLEKVLNSI
jgi:histidinol-phosphate/aromatic aminotransferase/cobyric acid decarboxylase-like protein